MPSWDEVTVGEPLPGFTAHVRRVDLIMYAGASGDFNPIHWNERVARSVGLPDVIAHGMLTMSIACRVVTEWTGDPGAIASYEVRFSRPVVVPDDDRGAAIRVGATVVDKLDDGRVVVDITAMCGDDEVLTNARAVALLRV